MTDATSRTARRLRVEGIVQGVGFRPRVYALARETGVSGFVRNDADGVVVHVEGHPDALDSFERALVAHAPSLARIDAVTSEDVEPGHHDGFRILASRPGAHRRTLVSPDVATCDACLDEVFDPDDRRYRYAFTNCTDCGPRYTITRDVPYDRPNTTMDAFAMCDACASEYDDPEDRRFHAQPVACAACGPTLRLVGGDRNAVGGDPIAAAARMLARGRIVAVKGLGGYHLACDACVEDAVATLRSRKHREEKPFALMVADLAAVRTLCDTTPEEEALLAGPRRPIVLLRRRPDAKVAASVAPGNRHLGVMLPYTPLHHLLLDAFEDAGGRGVLVMTSGNRSDEPIAYVDEEARERLGDIADAFLVHDRPIHVRCDDSVVRVHAGHEYPIRRSRGYAPEPIPLVSSVPEAVLAVGGELKHTLCLAKERHAFLSHHIGDLENWETMRSFAEAVEHLARLFSVEPRVVAYDLHPDYLSTKWALEQARGDGASAGVHSLAGLPLVGVQHHHAHIASCLADNGTSGPAIGLALDGTGYGDDGTLWGFEVLVCDLLGYRRLGHLRYVPLPGGPAAIREPWRTAAAYLDAAFGDDAEHLALPVVTRNADRWNAIVTMARKGLNAPHVSSAGRLFDAVAAVCDVRDVVSYEGQAAIELEQAAAPNGGETYDVPIVEQDGVDVYDGVALVRSCVERLVSGDAPAAVATSFHRTLADGLLELCRRARDRTGLDEVALSGGTFQNVSLLRRLSERLGRDGFRVHTHRRVPANDGGLSLGQAVVAAARTAAGVDRPSGSSPSAGG